MSCAPSTSSSTTFTPRRRRTHPRPRARPSPTAAPCRRPPSAARGARARAPRCRCTHANPCGTIGPTAVRACEGAKRGVNARHRTWLRARPRLSRPRARAARALDWSLAGPARRGTHHVAARAQQVVQLYNCHQLNPSLPAIGACVTTGGWLLRGAWRRQSPAQSTAQPPRAWRSRGSKWWRLR